MTTAALFVVAAASGATVRLLASVRLRRTVVWLPLGTLAVNLSGSFALGLLAGWHPPGSTVLGTAGLGALTTFSTFSSEVVDVAREDRRAAGVYVGISVVAGVALAWLGLRLGT